MAASINRVATTAAKVSASPSVLLTPAISLLPQYWATKIAAPEDMPKRIIFNRKKIWFPSPTAAMATAPSCPTIMVSTVLSGSAG